MPFFYDLQNAFTTSGTPLTEVTQMWAKTVANQETVSLFGVYFTARGAVAGGASGRVKHNTPGPMGRIMKFCQRIGPLSGVTSTCYIRPPWVN